MGHFGRGPFARLGRDARTATAGNFLRTQTFLFIFTDPTCQLSSVARALQLQPASAYSESTQDATLQPTRFIVAWNPLHLVSPFPYHTPILVSFLTIINLGRNHYLVLSQTWWNNPADLLPRIWVQAQSFNGYASAGCSRCVHRRPC